MGFMRGIINKVRYRVGRTISRFPAMDLLRSVKILENTLDEDGLLVWQMRHVDFFDGTEKAGEIRTSTVAELENYLSDTKSKAQLNNEINTFDPSNHGWNSLEFILDELFNMGVCKDDLHTLFRLFERFPKEDGMGVLWIIVERIEMLNLDYEAELRASLARKQSYMGALLLRRSKSRRTR